MFRDAFIRDRLLMDVSACLFFNVNLFKLTLLRRNLRDSAQTLGIAIILAGALLNIHSDTYFA